MLSLLQAKGISKLWRMRQSWNLVLELSGWLICLTLIQVQRKPIPMFSSKGSKVYNCLTTVEAGALGELCKHRQSQYQVAHLGLQGLFKKPNQTTKTQTKTPNQTTETQQCLNLLICRTHNEVESQNQALRRSSPCSHTPSSFHRLARQTHPFSCSSSCVHWVRI